MKVTVRKKEIKNGKHSLFLDITGHGRHKEYLKLFLYDKPKNNIQKLHNEETLRQAEQKRATRQLELQAQDLGQEYIAPTNETFHEFLAQYVKDYPKKDFRKFEATETHFTTFHGPKPFFLNQKFVDGFKSYLNGDAGLQGETPVVYKSKFKRICIAAYKKRIVKVNPDELDWKMSYDRHAMRKEVLNIDELRKLAAAPCGNEAVKRLFLFCCNTGLRFGDAKALKWKDIKGWKLKIEQGKTGRYLHADLNKGAIRYAGTPKEKDEPVFDLKGIDGINGVILTWYGKAKIDKHITTHCARHTFCTNLMRNKVDSRTIIGLMGWSESSGMRNLMRYAHLVDESVKLAVDSLPDIE